MNSAIFKVSRTLSLALIAASLVSLSAHAKPPKEDRHSKRNSDTEISIAVEGGYATITSGKEISHVVIWYCDLTQVKYEGNELLPYLDETGTKATFSGAPIMSVVAKSGTSKTSPEAYVADCQQEEPPEYEEIPR